MQTKEVSRFIEQNFADLRHALEDRRYSDVQGLLEQQRNLFGKLDIQDPESRELLKQGQELTHWALTLTLIQHAHTERALASVLKLKQLDEGYMPSAVCSGEFVSVRG